MSWKATMREKFRRFFWHGYWTDPVIFFSFVLAALVSLAMWVTIWMIVEPTDQLVIIHYNIYFGVDEIGNWKSIFLMPALSTAILFVNAVLSRFFYYKERLVSYLFAAMALLVQLLMAV